MSHMKDCALITQKYLKKIGQIIDVDEILLRPHHKQVWYYWLALAHFNLRNHYKTLEEAPEGISYITVINKTSIDYRWVGDKYVKAQKRQKQIVNRSMENKMYYSHKKVTLLHILIHATEIIV